MTQEQAIECPDCAAAALSPFWAGYKPNCKGCSIRALSESPDYFKAGKGGSVNLHKPYRHALDVIFGADWEAGHQLVKAEHARIKSARAAIRATVKESLTTHHRGQQ
jgi:hypothetical protein